MARISTRGFVAPVALALALAAGALDMRIHSTLFLWGCIGLTFVGLAFAKDTRLLLSGVFSDSDA